MANLLLLILRHPLRSLYFSQAFLSQVLIIVLRKILLPYFPSYQSLRLQLQRAYLSSATITFPDLTHRLPVTRQPIARVRKLEGNVPAYLIPGSGSLEDFPASISDQATPKVRRQKCVALFAHGGGYARGEARMYLNYMERWVREAAVAHIDLAFVSVEYPLSLQAQHPAQMNAFLQTYQHLLDSDISPKSIIFMGDSAGGGLSILSAIELTRRNIPQPAATVLISPWLDMSMSAYDGGNPAVESDYFLQANSAVDGLVTLFIGPERARDSPEINPLHVAPADLQGICPQLILVGGGEFALQDSKEWAKTCRTAGVEHKLVVEWGQLHIYAMGSAWVDPSVRRKTDGAIIDWIKEHVE